jgi:hypothetical protein
MIQRFKKTRIQGFKIQKFKDSRFKKTKTAVLGRDVARPVCTTVVIGRYEAVADTDTKTSFLPDFFNKTASVAINCTYIFYLITSLKSNLTTRMKDE